jgi:molybdopterin-biosynthesis enzyme MoeA-like protein
MGRSTPIRARSPSCTNGAEMSEARLRMTRIPKGAELILNKVSGAPGFWIVNVIVMAGVPSSCRRCSMR